MADLTIALNKLFVWQSHLEPRRQPLEIDGSKVMVTPKTLVGIEVELENYKAQAAEVQQVWGAKPDGSLRENGIEFVSVPLPASEVPTALKLLFGGINPDIKFPDRTSIHVHVDYRSMTLESILNTGVAYLPFERLFYKLVGAERYANIFCTPIQETRKIETLANFLQTGDPANLCREWEKYSGINFAPLSRYGTIEFRHMRGTGNIDEIITWVNLLLSLRRYARSRTFAQLWADLHPLNTSSQYEWFAHEVFGDMVDVFHNIPGLNFQRDMEDGIAAAKLIHPPSTFMKSIINDVDIKSPLLSVLKLRKEPKKDSIKINPVRWEVDGGDPLAAPEIRFAVPMPPRDDEEIARIAERQRREMLMVEAALGRGRAGRRV